MQDLDQLLLIHRHGVGTAIGSPPVVTGADPADIGVLIGADRLENELKMISYNLTKGEQLESVLTSTFKEIEASLAL